MSNLNRNKSGLFLMELIVVTLFFSVVAVIVLKIFIAGEKLSTESQVLTNTVIQAQNAAQLIKSDSGKTESLCNYYGTEEKDGTITVYFDGKFVPSDDDNASIKMVVTQTTSGEIVGSDIDFIDILSNQSVYRLETETFTGRNR
ncbi:MAG: hypothetical protein PHY44_07540 [Lachnospiraceae bacterium]|nr:hypothetical protein [Lachnospiraceae bacterium]